MRQKFFFIKDKDGVWKYWLGRHSDGTSYIEAIKRIK